jgi:hypothetical protein
MMPWGEPFWVCLGEEMAAAENDLVKGIRGEAAGAFPGMARAFPEGNCEHDRFVGHPVSPDAPLSSLRIDLPHHRAPD